MKPYILNYSETITVNDNLNSLLTDSTVMTRTLESTDDEDIRLKYDNASTVHTFTIESQDNEDIHLDISPLIKMSSKDKKKLSHMIYDSTLLTEVVEQEDHDMINNI
jgi:hypothetical protein